MTKKVNQVLCIAAAIALSGCATSTISPEAKLALAQGQQALIQTKNKSPLASVASLGLLTPYEAEITHLDERPMRIGFWQMDQQATVSIGKHKLTVKCTSQKEGEESVFVRNIEIHAQPLVTYQVSCSMLGELQVLETQYQE